MQRQRAVALTAAMMTNATSKSGRAYRRHDDKCNVKERSRLPPPVMTDVTSPEWPRLPPPAMADVTSPEWLRLPPPAMTDVTSPERPRLPLPEMKHAYVDRADALKRGRNSGSTTSKAQTNY
jgi:hypothetical protein